MEPDSPGDRSRVTDVGDEASSVRCFESRVRLSELGPTGGGLVHRIVEWMQEAAAFASTEAGYAPQRYLDMGAAWFIREIHLAIEAPVAYGESLRVETWVSDLRRFRSRREYRVWAGGRRVATAQADWFLLSVCPKTGALRPLRPDAQMIAAFPIWPEHAVARGRIPAWPDPGQGGPVACAERTVRPLEIDHNGHVNHVHYLQWLEDHAFELGAAPLCAVRIHFENDARAGERVSVTCRAQGGPHLSRSAARR